MSFVKLVLLLAEAEKLQKEIEETKDLSKRDLLIKEALKVEEQLDQIIEDKKCIECIDELIVKYQSMLTICEEGKNESTIEELQNIKLLGESFFRIIERSKTLKNYHIERLKKSIKEEMRETLNQIDCLSTEINRLELKGKLSSPLYDVLKNCLKEKTDYFNNLSNLSDFY